MIVTPFRDDGSVADDDVPRVVSFVLENGCQGVSALGLGAEVGKLTTDERLRIAAMVVAAAAGTPVVVGCSANDTGQSVRLAQNAAELGAAVVMIPPPPRPEWSRSQMLEHFEQVAAAVVPLPVMVQDAPAFIGVGLDRDFVRELCSVAPNVSFAKPEALPAAERTAELVDLDTVRVFGGHGALYYLDVLAAGAVGMIPGCELPAAYARIFELFRSGRLEEARGLFTQVLPLIVTEFQSLDYFVAASKLILAELGIIRRADVRGTSPVGTLGGRLLLDRARRAGAALA